MKIKIKTKSGHVPSYATEQSAGMDLQANIQHPISILPGETKLIPTGLSMELMPGYEAQIRPRSGLALKSGITVLNSPGTIDADYRGEIGVILHNTSGQTFTVNPGDRIAQMVIARYERVDFVIADQLSDTERGTGGFGSTGV